MVDCRFQMNIPTDKYRFAIKKKNKPEINQNQPKNVSGTRTYLPVGRCFLHKTQQDIM